MAQDDASYERELQEDLDENYQPQEFCVPQSSTGKIKLKACERCNLIKNEEQWKNDGSCPNCRHATINNEAFDGVISIMDPEGSWLARKLGLTGKKLVSGAYAVRNEKN